MVYEIQVEGLLDEHWAAWSDGLIVAHGPDGTTFLCGPVPDQAALYGLLDRARDLGLTLVSLRRVTTR
jgi:hypothetical protein